ncbi:phage tail tape measure protein [Streptomyces sp. NPDC029006]|uniref:phage tail tape measure protein n=1 Tax=Streptomyces sp. NPDC029006 TaxID=3155467 RepID=UPI003408C722
MSGQINTAVRDLTRLAQAASRADARLNRIGGAGATGLRRYREETSRVRESMKSLAAMGAGLGLTLGAAEVIKEGNEYQQAMNAFGATTNATQMQMHRAADTANQLGNDLKLPGATATDAAEGMLELAKAGFRTDQAITASRASLVLASAAQVNAADSAKYLGDMMDQFGLGADQAGKAADTLAATANAASGDIVDIYYAMKYAGPVAHGLGVTMQEAAAGVGMLGKSGILGQTAGTTLRGMFANLASPTKQMTEGLDALGIKAWDAQGRFKGLRNVIDGLSKAQHHMTQQDFAAAVKKAFGKPAMSGAIAMAHQGTMSFDALMQAVSQTGAATEIAAAKGKGLAGAMLQLKTQARQTGLTIYQGMSPSLEWLTRGLTNGLASATPKIEAFFRYFNDAATLFGPDIAAAVRREFGGIKDAVKGLSDPFKDMGKEGLADFLHVLLTVGKLAAQVLKNTADAVTPVISGLGDLAGQGGAASTALDMVVTALDLAATAVGALSGVLVPIGHVVGTLVSGFAALPGPIQQFVLAALLVRRVQPALAGLATTVSGRVTGSFRSLGEQMRYQQTLAAASGQSLSRYGAAFSALQSRVPVIGRMGAAFRTASAQGTGFTGTLRGIGAASATATRAMGAGLMGALGGGWGLAITAATVGLGYLATRQQEAAQAAAEHQARISSLSSALRESNGVVNESVRAIAAENLMQSKSKDWYGNQQRLVDLARKAKVPFGDLVDAYTNQGSSLKDLQTRLDAVTKAHTRWTTDAESGIDIKAPDEIGKAAESLRKGLGGVSGDFKSAAADAKAYNSAVKGSGDGVTAYSRLKDAVGALADKTSDADSRTRALREALDLLSGGSVSLQAAQARVHQAVTSANEAMAAGIDTTKGYSNALINANGTLNTTTKNGQQLFDTFTTIDDAASSAAVAAFDFAKSQGKTVPQQMAAARKEMQSGRDAVIKLAKGYKIGATEAGKIADSLGLIPGQVSILLSTHGVDSTLADLMAVQAQFQAQPTKMTITVDSLSTDARKDLEDLGYKVESLPNRQVKITAPTKGPRTDLGLLVAEMSKVPDGQDINIDVKNVQAMAGLMAVQAEIQKTPNAHRVTVSTLSSGAIAALEAVGLKTRELPDGRTAVFTANGQALGAIGAVGQALSNINGRSATTYINTVHTFTAVQKGSKVPVAKRDYADGGVVDYFADGAENHVAQIAPGGAYRVWAESETGGESYIPLSPAKRPRSRRIAEETIRRLGGDPKGIQWNADGSITDWRYDPQTGSLYSASDAGQAGHKTRKVKVKGKHGKTTTKEVDYFDLSAVEKKLRSAAKATRAWDKDLEKVADRVGGDVAEALAGMGEDGKVLAHKMATGSTKYIKDMAKALRDLQKTAKASLTDYTRQLGKANTSNKAFQDNLVKLAAMGYGDLAGQLAAQGDEAAQQLAASAAKDKGKARKANAEAKRANSSLTAEQTGELVQIIAAIHSSKTGIHDVAGQTGLDEDEIITVATKARAQISKSLGSRATKFVADLSRANKHLSYADGGIRAGMYATQGGIIRFAEPQTGGEAYLPLSPSKRRSALPVLADVTRQFGLGLTEAGAGRTVIIRQDAPLIGSQTNNITSNGSPRETARLVSQQVGWQLRRARRGGVAVRG